MLRISFHILQVQPTACISSVCQNSLLIKQEMQCLFSYISRAPDIYLIVPLFRGMRSASDVRRTLNSRRTFLHQEVQCIQCIFIAREIWFNCEGEEGEGGLRYLQWTETKISFSSNVVNTFTESSIYGSLAILDDYVPAQNCKRLLEKILISNSVVNCLLHCFDLSSMILKSRWYTSKPTRVSIQRNSIFAWLDVVFKRTVDQSTPQNYRNKATFWNFSKPVDMPWSTSVRQVVRLLIESAGGSS